jgi:hypothetical protein
MIVRQKLRKLGFWWLLATSVSLGAVEAQSAGNLPFQISVDGQEIDSTFTGSTSGADAGAFTPANIQVKFDGLGVKPMLNVSSVPPRNSYKADEVIRFLGSFNYSAWIDRAEIIVYEAGRRDLIVDTVQVSSQGVAEWQMSADGPKNMEYVLRVYDEAGRFDETRPLPLRRSVTADADPESPSIAPGSGEDRTAIRNIEVYGGAITVYGSHVPEGHEVTVLGEPVPVDGEGKFVAQRILPPGQHAVDISVLKDGVGLEFSREIAVPENEWFYFGLADFTAGYRINDSIEAVRPGEFNDTYTKGRLAFYLKGKIQGRYILTAAADTSERKLKDMFKGLGGKDPRSFLRRLDPDDYYPVYGDDSTAAEDAPTRGKFYVRLEKGASSIMWGNFKSSITGTTFMRNDRALYGAQAVFKSEAVAVNGEAKTQVEAHAAQPGTVPQRDVLRGTGGSAYFLKHQDITAGSETVTLEVRNAITGFVVQQKTLRANEDYNFDYVQGVLILRQPLQSTSGLGTENFLVVQYEFEPAAGDMDGYSYAGRAQQWLGDHVRVGLTGTREKTAAKPHIIYGADVRLQATEDTYVEAEIARSEGPGFSKSYSPDGGLTLQDGTITGADRKANGYRVVARASLEDLTGDRAEGKIKARYEHYEKGFATQSIDAEEKKTLWGLEGDVKLGERVVMSATYSEAQSGKKQVDREGQAKFNAALTDNVAIEPYAIVTQRKRPAVSKADEAMRVLAGGRLIYTWDEDRAAYVFAQTTISHSGKLKEDDRLGVGAKTRIADHVTASGEASFGDRGFAAEALINYEPSEQGRYYLGYKLEGDREDSSSWPFALLGDDLGTVVLGARQSLTDQLEVYGEENFDMFGERRTLTQTYGVNYNPTDAWSIGIGMEIGTIYDSTIDPATGKRNPDFDRKALSLALGYKVDDVMDAKLRGEARFENSDDDTRDLQSYLLAGDLNVRASEDWRLLASADAVITSATDTIKEGKYAEGSIGFAYRPAEGDRLNALVKYTFLYDRPGQDQVTIDGSKDGPEQQSHIFSADVNYDLTPQLTLGGKYGVRLGKTRDRIVGGDWENSDAHLAVVRADYHIVHDWDALIEGRALWSPTSDSTEYGLLLALYKHINDNMKVGIGYNFGRFSDDLRDQTYDDGGVFINLVGKI